MRKSYGSFIEAMNMSGAKLKTLIAGVVITLVIAVIYLFFYQATSSYRNNLVVQNTQSELIDSLVGVENDIHRLQIIGKDYLQRPSEIYKLAHHYGVGEIIQDISYLRVYSINNDDINNDDINNLLDSIVKTIAHYQEKFSSIVTLIEISGMNENFGLHKETRDAVHDIETIINNKSNINESYTLLRIKVSMLMLRRYEKDFLQRVRQEYISKFEHEYINLKKIISKVDGLSALNINIYAQHYKTKFMEMANNKLAIQKEIEALDDIVGGIKPLMGGIHEQISLLGENRYNSELESIKIIDYFLLLSLPLIMFLNWYLIVLFWRKEHSHEMEVLAKEDAILKEQLAQTTLRSIGDGVIVTDSNGIVTDINPVAAEILAVAHKDALGQSVCELFYLRHEVDDSLIDNPIKQCLDESRVVTLDSHTELCRSDGVRVPIDDSASPIISEDGRVMGAIMVFRDVSDQRNMIRKIEYQAHHDPLTGLINRAALKDELEIGWKRCEQLGEDHALMFLDLDHFKVINDTCGHHAGDELLKNLSMVIRQRIRGSDALYRLSREGKKAINDHFARIGGDEFSLFLLDCPLSVAHRIAQNIVDDIRAFDFSWEGKTFNVGVSIGVAPMSKDDISITDVLNNADAACYEAKNRGRGRVCVHSADDNVINAHKKETAWVPKLNKALNEDHFVLRRQLIAPIGDENNSYDHYEVLLSLMDDGELQPPGVFLPAAERFHLMKEIDRWVIKNTLLSMKKEKALDDKYSINLSGQSMGDESLLGYISDQVGEFNINPSRLIFEITETAAINNINNCKRLITELRQLGCQFSLDDFGSGLSSFAYIKNLKIDYLKIDGMFVKNLATDASDRIMVKAMNQLGHDLGFKTVAEYVEDKEILSILGEIGVDYAQGWGVSCPALWEPE